MKRIGFIYGLLFCLVLSVAAQEKVVKLKIVETSDVHGNYYPYNFITRHEWKGSLARIYSFVQKEREQYKENLILLDNGDILQGQPTAYYYNYIDTVSPHLCSDNLHPFACRLFHIVETQAFPQIFRKPCRDGRSNHTQYHDLHAITFQHLIRSQMVSW